MTNYEEFQPTITYPDKVDHVSLVVINTTTKEVSDPYFHWDEKLDVFGDIVSFPLVTKDERVANMIYSFTLNEASYKEAVQAHKKSVQDGVDRFSDYLKEEYGYSDQIHQVIFTKAWEDGHSEGLYSVEGEYSELSDFVDGIITALEQDK